MKRAGMAFAITVSLATVLPPALLATVLWTVAEIMAAVRLRIVARVVRALHRGIVYATDRHIAPVGQRLYLMAGERL